MSLLEDEEHCALYCEEQTFDEDFSLNNNDSPAIKDSPLPSSSPLQEHDPFIDSCELATLISKENGTHLCYDNLVSDGSLADARREAVGWVLSVNARYGFSAFTAALAVNYFDRFLLSVRLQNNKPWATQLTAVACLSLAAKIQETRVPLLLDLQVEESRYVFEAKTIQRMELLVLSSLEWRMNPVTPFAFFHPISRRLCLKPILQREFLLRCESLLLSLIADARLGIYLPSVIASATMLYVVKEADPDFSVSEYHDQLMNVVEKTIEGKVIECYELIREISSGRGSSLNSKHFNGHKRRILSVPSSPIGVECASFSCDSSSESWVVESSLLTSPDNDKYGFKRKRENPASVDHSSCCLRK
ncbi:cyclin-D3-3-like [Punica granatum]|uniref:Cyclin-like domain-containing protein n=2 Tax=Punica granatum TaxID=22663 RepID=A0A218VYJ2_PUNGR|nr:cyclin-D3-3-like [Punica granatum]OWM65657.1 hypothetical protein CDL15_Pgr017154 [Punica granatum]PKI49834.1 hypothetical protein CRG98_029778 [Punica granatum]